MVAKNITSDYLVQEAVGAARLAGCDDLSPMAFKQLIEAVNGEVSEEEYIAGVKDRILTKVHA